MRKRNFASLAILSTVTTLYTLTENSWFNSWLSSVVGASDFEVNVMVALNGVLGSIFFIIFGAISDNIRSNFGRRKPILVLGLFLSAIFIFIFGLTYNYIGCLIIDGFILACTGNMMWSGYHSVVADLSEVKTRGKLNSNLFLIGSVGGAVITIIEITSDTVDDAYTEQTHLLIFYITAISLIVAAISLFFTLKEKSVDKLPEKRSWLADIKNINNVEEFKAHRQLYRLLIALIVVASAKQAFFPLFIIFRQRMGFNEFEKTMYFLGMGLGSFAGTMLLSRLSDKHGRKRIILSAIPFTILGLILSSLCEVNFWLFFVGNFLTYACFEGIFKVQEVWSQDLADPDARGKFLGILNISHSAGRVPGGLLGGLFSELLGIWAIFLVAAVFMIASIPLFRRVKDKVEVATFDA